MRSTENYCVGCEHCVNCGRREDVEIYICDCCGDMGYEPDFLIDFYDYEICAYCNNEIENGDYTEGEVLKECERNVR